MKRTEKQYKGCNIIVTSHQGDNHPNSRCRAIPVASIESVNGVKYPSWSQGFNDEAAAMTHAETFIDWVLDRPCSAEYHEIFGTVNTQELIN